MNFFKKKELKVILWSYGPQGKTNLLYRGLKGNKDITPKMLPTIGFNVETITFNDININFWDIGGACKIKELRHHYFPSSDAIIFLIDSSEQVIASDLDFQDNFQELQKCINIIEDKPLLIAITKIDIRKTSTLDIINAYQLYNLFKRKQKFGIIECSSFTLEGIKEIEYWLSSIVKNKTVFKL